MSDLKIEAALIDSVDRHPNADRLDLLHIGAYTVCDTRDKYVAGEVVAFFPPDILIPNKLATQLGVDQYLKEAIYPGDAYKSKCRVSAIRLRGCPSFGFVFKTKWAHTPGDDLTDRFHGFKFDPPAPAYYKQGLQAPGDPRFHCYTDIENYRNSRYHDAIPEGTPVRITEKCHGTCSRIAAIAGNFMVGSHRCTVQQQDKSGNTSVYWKPLNSNLTDLLACLAEDSNNVIVFGEIFGSKIQCMDYGITGDSGYRVFDISVNGTYLSWEAVNYYTTRFCVPTVPLLYTGPFSHEVVAQLVDGPTTLAKPEQIRSKFKGREGIVITPLEERFSPHLGGRMILKAVSCDYLEHRRSDSH